MDEKIKSHSKCTADKYNKGSLVALVISVLLAILLFVRIEFVNRKSEATEAKLVFRIQRIEEEMQDKTQNRIMEILQSNVMSAIKEKRTMDVLNSGKLLMSCYVFKALLMQAKNCKHDA